ncbi:hypothetical protein EMCG_00753 [[Emmonsia] crescens]|uniref:Uncharacterized protein n=1 Tax=[Emmonsia] crescens TaxID=73230 RepID=A0A0G2J6Z9_9EURO|nr:hypothetical protein EMCG_00753 [Emmonsia crescens UAMH 3008]
MINFFGTMINLVGRTTIHPVDAEILASIGGTNISESDLHQVLAETIYVGKASKPPSTENAENVEEMSPTLNTLMS